MTGQPVPKDDLPSAGGVPASDLPAPPEPRSAFAPEAPVEAMLSIGTGMVAPVAGGWAGLAGAVLPGPTGQGARWSEKVTDALTYQPRGKVAQNIVDVAAIPGEVVEHVASKVGDHGEQVSPGLATIGKTSVHALPLLLGARAGTKQAPKLTPKQVAAAEARDAGFTLTPEEMGAGPVGRTAGSLAGEPRLARAISNKNQSVMVEKLADDIGIPKGTPVDFDAIKTVLKREHLAYQNVRGTGTVRATRQYATDLDNLNAKYANISRDFPELAPKDVQAVIQGARRQVFDANSAVDLISQLRQSATDAFASRQSGLGKVYRGVADAVEAELGRHLQKVGQPELYKQFTDARTRIAQAHALEDAMLAPDKINPRVYAEAYREGAPLTGGAQQVGEFAARNERSAQRPSSIGTGATAHDIAIALLQRAGKGAANLGLDLLSVGARPALRSAIASRPGQFLIDPRTRIASPAAQAMGVTSVPRFQEEIE